MSCKLSDKCDNVFACNVLRPNVELLGCNFYKPKKPMTNEEWFIGLSTEEKAKWLNQQMMYAAREQGYFTVEGLIKWLKQLHTEKE